MSALRTGRLYPPGISWYSLLEAESAPGHMDLSYATEKIPATPGIDPGTFRLVAQCLNHYATPGPFSERINEYFVSVKETNILSTWVNSVGDL